MSVEFWKKIESFEGYEVSSEGRVRNSRGKILGGWIHDGYCKVGLSVNSKVTSKLIHRLVAEAFIPKIDGKIEVDHINRDRQDNRLSNLRWADDYDQRENCNRKAGKTNIKNVYKSYNLFMVTKCAKGIRTPCKYFKTLEDAIEYRNSLV